DFGAGGLRGEGDEDGAACSGEDGGTAALEREVRCGLEVGDVEGGGAGVGESNGLRGGGVADLSGGEGERALRGGVGCEWSGVGRGGDVDGGGRAGEVDEVGTAEGVAF